MGINPDEARMMTLFINVKRSKQLDLNQAIKYIHISNEDLKHKLNSLMGKNNISGKFEGDILTIQSDIDKFVKLLEAEFIG